MHSTQIVYHPAWATNPWPGLDQSALRPDPLITWLALALALAIAGLAAAQLLITASLLTLSVGYALAVLPAGLGLGITLGVARNEVQSWTAPEPLLAI